MGGCFFPFFRQGSFQDGGNIFPDKTQKDGADGQLLDTNAEQEYVFEFVIVRPFTHIGVGDLMIIMMMMMMMAMMWIVSSSVGLSISVGTICHVLLLLLSFSHNDSFQRHDIPTIVRGPKTHNAHNHNAHGQSQLGDGPWQRQTTRTNVSLGQLNPRIPGGRFRFDMMVMAMARMMMGVISGQYHMAFFGWSSASTVQFNTNAIVIMILRMVVAWIIIVNAHWTLEV